MPDALVAAIIVLGIFTIGGPLLVLYALSLFRLMNWLGNRSGL